MWDEIFNGLVDVADFERKLSEYSRQDQVRFSLEAKTSMNQSQMSTAANSTVARKNSTIIAAPRRVGIVVNENRALELFVNKVQKLISNDPDCPKIAMEFGISLHKLNYLPSQELREDYILQKLQEQVNDSLKLWKNKVDQKHLQKSSLPHKDLDIFDWVDIHTKFRQLKKQLKFALVEVINDKSNQSVVQNTGIISSISYTKPDTSSIVDELNALLRKVKTVAKDELLEWNSSMEENFRQRRQSAKQRLHNKISSSSFNVVGMGEVTCTFDKTQQNKQERERLLAKFNNADPMQESELLYLVNTSVLLNKCADKKFIQNAINRLDQEIVSDIELQIAEQILKSYNQLQKQFNASRHQYLKQKNSHRQQIAIPQKEKPTNRVLLSKVVQMLRQFKTINKQTISEKDPQIQIYKEEFKKGNPIANPLVWKFKDKMMKLLRKKQLERRNKKLVFRVNHEKPIYPSPDNDLTLSKVRRLTHPSSKVFLKDVEGLKMTTPAKVKLDYQLKIYKKDYEGNKDNFSIFYSGGPIQPRPRDKPINDLPYKGKWITSEIETIAANRIKRAIQAFIMRKRMRAVREQKQKELQKLKEKRQRSILGALRKMQAKPHVEIDVEEGYKRLKQALSKTSTHKVTTQTIDYRMVAIPKKLIQLKLKQRKLFLALKLKNSQWTEHSGFVFDARDVNCYDPDMYCPLYYAAMQQSLTFCTFLLSAGADVNMPCRDGMTPTFAAFQSSNILVINLMISHGADLTILNDEGKNPLCYASVKLLKELNLNQSSVFRSQPIFETPHLPRARSMIQLDEHAHIHMEPMDDSKQDVAWHNDTSAGLRTFYPSQIGERFREQKLKLDLERQIKAKLKK